MVLVFEVLLAGGVIYAGARIFRKRKQNREVVWLTERVDPQPKTGVPAMDEVSLNRVERRINRDFAISSISLGMSITGSLVYPPLGLASVPLTIYGALPTFENTYEAIFCQGRAKLAIISSIVIIGSLATNNYFLASLFQWGHHLNNKLVVEIDYAYRQFLVHLFGAKSRSIWVLVDGVEVKISREELKVGDIVVVNEGEIIPVDGTITDGTALVDMYILTGQARPVEMKSGDRVLTASFVLSGRICVQAKKV